MVNFLRQNIAALFQKLFLVAAVFLVFTYTNQASAQEDYSKQEWKLLKNARGHYAKGEMEEAKKDYHKLLEIIPDDYTTLYELGVAYYSSAAERGKAIIYLNKAEEVADPAPEPDLHYYQGRVYQYLSQFDKAIEAYRTYKTEVRKSDDYDAYGLNKDVNRYIEMCEYGQQYFENHASDLKIENLGSNINSTSHDYTPVVKNDESLILFTSRREGSTGGKIYEDKQYYEDIYYSRYIAGQWTPSINVDSTNEFMNEYINSADHDAPISFNEDETRLYIYRAENLWKSEKKEGYWGLPVNLEDLNTRKARETHIYINENEDELFVVSEKKGGYGGKDIYQVKKKADGEWGEMKNLGPNINTRYDEEACFLSPDQSTLYFSSQGHSSLGGFDVFKAIQEDGKWQEPENLGSPINTAGNEIYYVTNREGSIAYYSSDRPGGFGGMDIYRLSIECLNITETEIRGVVVNGNTKKPIDATIYVADAITKELISTYTSDPETGEYLMKLQTKKAYDITLDAHGYLSHKSNFTVPKQCEFYQLYQEIEVENLEGEDGKVYAQQAEFKNAFFNIDKTVKEIFRDQPEVKEIKDLDEEVRDSLLTVYVNSNEYERKPNLSFQQQYLDTEEEGTRYDSLISQADALFATDSLESARGLYANAQRIKGYEAKPRTQIDKIDGLLGQLTENKVEQDIDVIYLDKVEKGDNAMAVKEYPDAKTNFQDALRIKPEEAYPDVKIKEIDKIVEEYDAYVAKGDEAFKQRDYPVAKDNYVEALKLMPNEEYPDVKIKAIDEIIKQYDEQITMADDAFNDQNYPTAKNHYIEALKLMPNEEYPDVKLKEIAELETQALAAAEEIPEPEKPIEKVEEPVEEIPMVEEKPEPAEVLIFKNILFDFDKSDLRQASIAELTKINTYLKANNMELNIDGHADAKGTDSYNMALSKRRSLAAYNYLANKGIDKTRLEYHFFGESKPVASNTNADGSDNPDGRQQNRRCEFKISQPSTAMDIVLKF